MTEGPGIEGHRPTASRQLVRGTVLALTIVVLFLVERRYLALALLGTLVAVSLLPPLRNFVDKLTARVERAIASAVLWVGMSLLYFGVLTPIAAIARLMRRPLITPRKKQTTTWVHRQPSDRSSMRRQFIEGQREVHLARRRSLPARTFRVVTTLIGVVVLIATIDVGLGNALGATQGSKDPRPQTAAMRGSRWGSAYYEEFHRMSTQFVPFVAWRHRDFRGSYINVEEGVRSSYDSGTNSDRAIDVYFFGGSTMWGTGQRDAYTVPSAVVRLAQIDGISVRAHNYGQSGYVLWQELHLFGSLLSKGDTPDVAIFVDGVNEIGPQIEARTTEPTHMNVPHIKSKLEERRDLRTTVKVAWRYYRQQSLLARAARNTRGLATEVSAWLFRRSTDGPQRAPRAESPAALANRTLTLYRRSVDIASRLAESYDVGAYFFWQPSIYTKRIRPGEHNLIPKHGLASTYSAVHKQMKTGLRPPTIDITGVLDRLKSPVMVDEFHTNEKGAAAVAAAIYARIKPRLIELARAQEEVPGVAVP